MIRNPREVERAKRKHERAHRLTLEQEHALLNAMYEEARREFIEKNAKYVRNLDV